MEFSKDLNLAVKAAKEAGEIIKEGFGNIKEISQKEGKGIVTNIDKASEEKIIEILSPLGYSFIGEESGETKTDSKYCWAVDPLDGTTNFAKGIPLFCTSIALLKNNMEVILGVIYNPISGEIFYGEKGKGAFLNDKKIYVSKETKLQDNIIILNYGYAEINLDIYLEVDKRLVKKCYLRKLGATALELCYVAQGSAEAFLSTGDELWDYAAGILIVSEAGGKVTDWKGNVWNNSSSFIFVSNGFLDDEIIPKISGLQK